MAEGSLAADRFRARLARELAGNPGSGYLAYVKGVGVPDLDSAILVEIPSYDDPDVVNTVRSARAMAANPDRVRIAVYLQDDHPDRLAALEAIPGTRVRHCALADAPGTCGARYRLCGMREGEDFVLHADSHMRFAAFWDVAVIDQWRSCGTEKAVLTGYPAPFGADLLDRPADDPAFTGMASVGGRLLVPAYFPRHRPEASLRVASVPFDGPGPRLGAFVSAGWLFCRGEADEKVPVDPKMNFFGDEMGMCVRYWTHGYDIYQPGVACGFHLYADERAKAGGYGDAAVRAEGRSAMTEEGIARGEREYRRMEKLLGIYDRPDVDLGRFGLGAERSLEAYQEFCGVDFRCMRIRKFAVRGLFGQPHDGPDDMGYYDWERAYTASACGPAVGEKLDVRVHHDVADRFEAACAREHWDRQAAFTEAIRRWMDENRRGRFA